MIINASSVELLLYESEGVALDFKQAQYPFEKASNEEKGELLKDILAFANAWRRADAFILVGVKDIPGNKASVQGVASHIDDAKLQQFVNSKVNRPIEFHYKPFELDGKKVGLIHIPLQTRPFLSLI